MSTAESHKKGMWSNNTQIHFDNHILLVPYLLKVTYENMQRKQWESPEIARSECLSHQTCKMKSCAPPGMHSVCVIHHIRHYQSYNEGFGSTPMLSFLSHSSDIFFFQIINYLIPFSLHKYSNTGVAWRLEKLSCDRKVTTVWICQICFENVGGGAEWAHHNLHQSALEQHTELSKAPLQLLRTVCNPLSPVATSRHLPQFIN